MARFCVGVLFLHVVVVLATSKTPATSFTLKNGVVDNTHGTDSSVPRGRKGAENVYGTDNGVPHTEDDLAKKTTGPNVHRSVGTAGYGSPEWLDHFDGEKNVLVVDDKVITTGVYTYICDAQTVPVGQSIKTRIIGLTGGNASLWCIGEACGARLKGAIKKAGVNMSVIFDNAMAIGIPEYTTSVIPAKSKFRIAVCDKSRKNVYSFLPILMSQDARTCLYSMKVCNTHMNYTHDPSVFQNLAWNIVRSKPIKDYCIAEVFGSLQVISEHYTIYQAWFRVLVDNVIYWSREGVEMVREGIEFLNDHRAVVDRGLERLGVIDIVKRNWSVWRSCIVGTTFLVSSVMGVRLYDIPSVYFVVDQAYTMCHNLLGWLADYQDRFVTGQLHPVELPVSYYVGIVAIILLYIRGIQFIVVSAKSVTEFGNVISSHFNGFYRCCIGFLCFALRIGVVFILYKFTAFISGCAHGAYDFGVLKWVPPFVVVFSFCACVALVVSKFRRCGWRGTAPVHYAILKGIFGTLFYANLFVMILDVMIGASVFWWMLSTVGSTIFLLMISGWFRLLLKAAINTMIGGDAQLRINRTSEQFKICLQVFFVLHDVYIMSILRTAIISSVVIPMLVVITINFRYWFIALCFCCMIALWLTYYFWCVANDGLYQTTIVHKGLTVKMYNVRVMTGGVSPGLIMRFWTDRQTAMQKVLGDLQCLEVKNDLELQREMVRIRTEVRKANQAAEMQARQLYADVAAKDAQNVIQLVSGLMHGVNQQLIDQCKAKIEMSLIRADHEFGAAGGYDDPQFIARERLYRMIDQIFDYRAPEDVPSVSTVWTSEQFEELLRHIRTVGHDFEPPVIRADDPGHLAVNMPNVAIMGRNDMPLGRYEYELNIAATSPDEACAIASRSIVRRAPNVPFRGVCQQYSGDSLPGIYEWDRVDDTIKTVVEKTVSSKENLQSVMLRVMLEYVWQPFMSYIEKLSDLFGDGEHAIHTAVVALLFSNGVYPDIDRETLKEMIFNQEYPISKFDVVATGATRVLDLINQRNRPVKNNAKRDIREIYNSFIKTRDARREGVVLTDVAIPLDDLMSIAGLGTRLPKSLPSGLVMVSYAGRAYIVNNRYYKVFGDICSPMEKVTDARICFSIGFNGDYCVLGHLTSGSICEDGRCRAIMCGRVDYGYADNTTKCGLAIGNAIVEIYHEYTDENIHAQSNLAPNYFPMSSVFGIVKRGTIVGGASVIEHNGRKLIVTAAHCVARRCDNTNPPPGEWSKPPSYSDSRAYDQAKRDFGCDVELVNGFYIPEFICVENLRGHVEKCKVEKIDGEVAYLVPFDSEFLARCDAFRLEEGVFRPHYLYGFEQRKHWHIPRMSPIYVNVGGNNPILEYHSGSGHSGCAMGNSLVLSAVHLGGTKSGKGMAYARLVPRDDEIDVEVVAVSRCVECKGLHYGECLTRYEYGEEFEQVNGQENNWKRRQEKELLGRHQECNVILSLEGGKIFAKVFDCGSATITPYDIETFVKSGVTDLVGRGVKTRVHVEDGLQSIKDVFVMYPDIEVVDLEKTVRKERLHGQVAPLEIGVYNDLANRIGESNLLTLLEKSLSELQEEYQVLLDSSKSLKELKATLETTKKAIHNSVEYQRLMEDYRRKTADYLQRKTDYNELLRSMIENKTKERELRKSLIARHNETVAKVKTLKKDLHDTYMDRIRKCKDIGVRILGSIAEIEERKKIKRSDLSAEELQSINQQITEAEEQISKWKEAVKNLRRQMELGPSAKEFAADCDFAIKRLRDLYDTNKKRRQHLAKELNEKQKDLQEKFASELAVDAPPRPPPIVPFNEPKPKLPKIEQMNIIQESLTELRKALKEVVGYQTVIGTLITSEKEYIKNKQLAERMSDERSFDSGDVEEVKEHLEGQAIRFTEYAAAMRSVPSLFNEKLARMTAELLQLAIDMALVKSFDADVMCCVEHWELVDTVYMDIRAKVADLLGLSQENCDGQSIEPVYLYLTPNMANSNTFRSNCIAPVQPATLSCMNCEDVFKCDCSHLDKETGCISDKACTMSCMFALTGKLSGHRQDCANQRNISMVSGFSGAYVHFNCVHAVEGQIKQVTNCSLHTSRNKTCLHERAQNGSISIVLNNQVRFIQPDCLFNILYRMANCASPDKCSRRLDENELAEITRCKQLAKGKKPEEVLTIGDQQFFVSPATCRGALKITTLLADHKIDVVRVDVMNQEALMVQGIEEMIDSRIKRELGSLTEHYLIHLRKNEEVIASQSVIIEEQRSKLNDQEESIVALTDQNKRFNKILEDQQNKLLSIEVEIAHDQELKIRETERKYLDIIERLKAVEERFDEIRQQSVAVRDSSEDVKAAEDVAAALEKKSTLDKVVDNARSVVTTVRSKTADLAKQPVVSIEKPGFKSTNPFSGVVQSVTVPSRVDSVAVEVVEEVDPQVEWDEVLDLIETHYVGGIEEELHGDARIVVERSVGFDQIINAEKLRNDSSLNDVIKKKVIEVVRSSKFQPRDRAVFKKTGNQRRVDFLGQKKNWQPKNSRFIKPVKASK